MSNQRESELSIAIRRYLCEMDAYHEANKRFVQASDDLRAQMGASRTVVANLSRSSYLVSTDADGHLDVEKIESV